MVYKFQSMFRGQQVIIEYGLADGEIDYAIVSNDNPYFVHPDYAWDSDYLDDFHTEVYKISEAHLKKIA